MTHYVRALRPEHWIKNLVVLAALFFALGDAHQASKLDPFLPALARSVAAAVLFCLISSGIYIYNDIRDLPLDREHPLKRQRPIAAGLIPVGAAWVMAVALLSVGLACAAALSRPLAAVAAVYVLLQMFYTTAFKKVAMLDVLVLASGFVLRALAGAVTIGVTISPWLLLCTFLLALFLGFCKRRHEKALLEGCTGENRPSLGHYDERLLDQVIAIVAASTIVSYSVYTLSHDTVEKFGSSWLGFSIPFVIFGIFRYLDLVYRHEQGSRPERLLLTDPPLLADIFLYAAVILAVVLRSRFVM